MTFIPSLPVTIITESLLLLLYPVASIPPVLSAVYHCLFFCTSSRKAMCNWQGISFHFISFLRLILRAWESYLEFNSVLADTAHHRICGSHTTHILGNSSWLDHRRIITFSSSGILQHSAGQDRTDTTGVGPHSHFGWILEAPILCV